MRARAKGGQLGRKPVGSKIERHIRKLRADSLGKLRIAATVGCGVSVVQRVVAEDSAWSQLDTSVPPRLTSSDIEGRSLVKAKV